MIVVPAVILQRHQARFLRQWPPVLAHPVARVQAFAERLKEHNSIPLTFWDERLSTVEAQRLLAERQQAPPGAPTGKRSSRGRMRRTTRRKHRQHEIDALAAAVILQEYLDHASSETGD